MTFWIGLEISESYIQSTARSKQGLRYASRMTTGARTGDSNDGFVMQLGDGIIGLMGLAWVILGWFATEIVKSKLAEARPSQPIAPGDTI